MSDTLTVEVTRGPAVESVHRIHAVLMNGEGAVRAAYGDISLPVFPRSSIKPVQAVALVESGAAEALGVSAREIALACASHSGEEIHVKLVAEWLQRLGLNEAALECGPQYGASSPPLRNNCSGKHAGMLTLALFLKAPVAGYTKPEHPVQQAILSVMSEMCDTPVEAAMCGTDGCSAPNPALPLETLARLFARFMRPRRPVRATACRRILRAMTENPELVGGEGRLDTVLMKAAGGKIMSKTGAEGVYAAVIPERDSILVLKAEDGASRAAQAALHALLEKHGLADAGVLEAIRPLTLPALKNWRGITTGRTKCRFSQDG